MIKIFDTSVGLYLRFFQRYIVIRFGEQIMR